MKHCTSNPDWGQKHSDECSRENQNCHISSNVWI